MSNLEDTRVHRNKPEPWSAFSQKVIKVAVLLFCAWFFTWLNVVNFDTEWYPYLAFAFVLVLCEILEVKIGKLLGQLVEGFLHGIRGK